jgi:hypothetical protein
MQKLSTDELAEALVALIEEGRLKLEFDRTYGFLTLRILEKEEPLDDYDKTWREPVEHPRKFLAELATQVNPKLSQSGDVRFVDF